MPPEAARHAADSITVSEGRAETSPKSPDTDERLLASTSPHGDATTVHCLRQRELFSGHLHRYRQRRPGRRCVLATALTRYLKINRTNRGGPLASAARASRNQSTSDALRVWPVAADQQASFQPTTAKRAAALHDCRMHPHETGQRDQRYREQTTRVSLPPRWMLPDLLRRSAIILAYFQEAEDNDVA